MRHLYTGILLVDKGLTVCWANTQAEQLFSVSRSRLLNSCILDLLSPLKNGAEFIEISNKLDVQKEFFDPEQKGNSQILAQQFSHATNYQQPFLEYNQQITGLIRPLLVDYSVTPIEQDNEPFFLIEIWGKNRQSRLDREQRRQEQHDVTRQMLRSVAHEVKNPLAGIRGAAQLLIKQTNPSSNADVSKNQIESNKKSNSMTKSKGSKIKTYANIVISETDRLTHLIEQLLGSNQLPNWQAINIHEPLEHVLTLTETQHPNVCIKRDYDLSLPELIADKNQLIQVFLNLINNACDAMLEQEPEDNYKPTLTISTRIDFQYTIGKVHHRQVIKVCIKDNGAGIAPELLERIFYPLVTGRASGTGLGLSLVQDMVNRHHGAIQVRSNKGDTEFCVCLPLKQPLSETPYQGDTQSKH